MGFQMCCALTVFFVFTFVANLTFCVDLKKTGITIVTDETRYTTKHPNAVLRPFDKVNHVKGNIIFSIGERIDGDHLILTYLEQTSYTRLTDIEVLMSYPAEGRDGLIISFVQVFTDLSTTDADIYFIDDGGIGETYADMLFVANKTDHFGYQIYLYGY